jgi:serine/threonine protein phosphatase PrpC
MTQSFGPYLIGHGTHPGPRESNQDTVLSIGLPDDRWLLAVADGMGGLEEGELASQVALSALYKALCEGSSLEEAVREANTAVNREADGRVMGTTLVAAILSGRQVQIANVGDSRAYNSDLLGLLQVTRDHTMAEEAALTGEILFHEPGDGPNRWAGALARYLGAEDDVEVDSFGPLDLLEGGWLLLCSDGLHGVMSLDEIDAFLVGQTDAEKAAEGLIEEALARKTGDNVSVALAGWPDLSAVPAPAPRQKDPVSPWKPERILIQSPRTKTPTHPFVTAGKIFLVVVPLMIALVFFLNWILSR